MTPSCILHPSISLRRLLLPTAAPEWEKLSSATMELNSHKSLAFLRLPSGHCNNQHNRRTQIRTELHSSYSFTLDGLPSRLSVAPSADLILIAYRSHFSTKHSSSAGLLYRCVAQSGLAPFVFYGYRNESSSLNLIKSRARSLLCLTTSTKTRSLVR